MSLHVKQWTQLNDRSVSGENILFVFDGNEGDGNPVISNILAFNVFLPTSSCIILAGPVTHKIGKEQYSDLVSSLQ